MTGCYFCEKKTEPTYKESDTMRKFLTIRGKIVSREKSRVCQWHQRKLSTEIKKARSLMLLPYVVYEE
ncbi:MAG: 30S ribosomal protein S18 [Patescibacteria group bacterium]|jgi:small subunit ribosomal protein S18